MYSVLAAVLLSAYLAHGYQYPSICPQISPKNVELDKYSGQWFNVMHTQPESFTCSKNRYTIGENSGEQLLTIDWRYKLHNGTVLEQQSSLFRIAPSIEDNFRDQTGDGKQIGNLFVLDIDYDKYAVEYVCTVVEGKPYEVVIFSTRSGTLDEDLKAKMVQVLVDNHVTTLLEDFQSGCIGL